MKKIKYKGLKLIIKEVPYQFEYYCIKLNGYIILYEIIAINKNIQHKIAKCIAIISFLKYLLYTLNNLLLYCLAKQLSKSE